jgi:hypothetical protein
MTQLGGNDLPQLADVGANSLQQWADDAFFFLDQRGEQVDRFKLRIPRVGGQLMRLLQGFLGFDRQFVKTKCHGEFFYEFVMRSVQVNQPS